MVNMKPHKRRIKCTAVLFFYLKIDEYSVLMRLNGLMLEVVHA